MENCLTPAARAERIIRSLAQYLLKEGDYSKIVTLRVWSIKDGMYCQSEVKPIIIEKGKNIDVRSIRKGAKLDLSYPDYLEFFRDTMLIEKLLATIVNTTSNYVEVIEWLREDANKTLVIKLKLTE